MTIDPRSYRYLLIAALATFAVTAAPAAAQEPPPGQAAAQGTRPELAPRRPDTRFVLELELAQGVLFDDERDGLAWTGAVRALPGLAVGKLQLNALAEGVYTNPEGDFLAGARVSGVLLPLLQGSVGIRAAAEGGYLVRAKNARAALGVLGDLGGILLLGAWVGRDFEHKAFYALISVGSDVMTYGDPVGAIIAAGPMEDDGDGR